MDKLPKISITTVCFNSARTLAQTIESVLAQKYPNISMKHGDSNGFEIMSQLDYIIQEMYEYESILLKFLGGCHVTDN